MDLKADASLNGLSTLHALRQAHDRHQRPCDPDMEKKFPHLFAILSDVKISETEEIEPPFLIVKNTGGQWSLAVIVTGLAMAGDILANTLAEGLVEVNRRMGNGTFPWRPMGKKTPTLKKIAPQQKSP